MSKPNKQTKARELLWLAIAFMSLIAAVHSTIYESFKSGWYFWCFILIALFLYLIRRNMRIRDNEN